MWWQITLEIVGIIGGIATLLAFFLAPMFYLGAKIDKLREDMHQEMKDFHGRLEHQDAEFKAGLLLLEERMRK